MFILYSFVWPTQKALRQKDICLKCIALVLDNNGHKLTKSKMICFKTARLSMCTHRHKQNKEMNKIYIRNVSCSKSRCYSVLRLSACPLIISHWSWLWALLMTLWILLPFVPSQLKIKLKSLAKPDLIPTL